MKPFPLAAPVAAPSSPSQSHQGGLDSVLFYGVVALLLFGPLAFGAVEPWAYFVLEIGAALLFALWIVGRMRSGGHEVRWNPLFAPMLAFAVLVGWQLAFGRSAYAYVTQVAALQYCAYGLLCFLAAQTVRSESRVRQSAVMIFVYGAAVALFALIQGFTPNGKVYWLRTLAQPGWIYGPYVSHSHYAGLMEMLAPLPLVYCLTSQAAGVKRVAAAGAGILMGTTIFLSGSRGGMLAFLVQLAVLVALAISGKRRPRSARALLLAIAMLLGLVLWLGGNELAHRVASIHSETQAELSGGTRLTIDRDCLRMFRQRPLLGWGLGTFPIAYPQFRTFYTNLFVNQAHNDYLQLLVETGALGFAVMVWFLAVVFREAGRKLAAWRSSVDGTLAAAALLGCIGILFHSFVDFNLQIPANAALFFVLCTLAASPRLEV